MTGIEAQFQQFRVNKSSAPNEPDLTDIVSPSDGGGGVVLRLQVLFGSLVAQGVFPFIFSFRFNFDGRFGSCRIDSPKVTGNFSGKSSPIVIHTLTSVVSAGRRKAWGGTVRKIERGARGRMKGRKKFYVYFSVIAAAVYAALVVILCCAESTQADSGIHCFGTDEDIYTSRNITCGRLARNRGEVLSKQLPCFPCQIQREIGDSPVLSVTALGESKGVFRLMPGDIPLKRGGGFVLTAICLSRPVSKTKSLH